MLSHLGNLAKTKARELKAVGVERIVSPMFIHAYHNGHQRDTTGVDELGYSFNSLTLSATDFAEMKRAYLTDTSVHLGVPVATIYRIIALGETGGFDGTLVKKVQVWKDTVFFAQILPDTDAPLLYAPASMQVLMWPNANEERPDLTNLDAGHGDPFDGNGQTDHNGHHHSTGRDGGRTLHDARSSIRRNAPLT